MLGWVGYMFIVHPFNISSTSWTASSSRNNCCIRHLTTRLQCRLHTPNTMLSRFFIIAIYCHITTYDIYVTYAIMSIIDDMIRQGSPYSPGPGSPTRKFTPPKSQTSNQPYQVSLLHYLKKAEKHNCCSHCQWSKIIARASVYNINDYQGHFP